MCLDVEDVRRIMGVREYREPWRDRALDWLGQRPLASMGVALAVSGVMWAVVIGAWFKRALVTTAWRDLSDTVTVLWRADTDGWLGPMKWGLVALIAGTVWFLAVGVVEWWRRRR